MDALCQFLLKVSQWFWSRRYYFLLEKGVGLYLKKIIIPFSLGCFVLTLAEFGPLALEKKMKM